MRGFETSILIIFLVYRPWHRGLYLGFWMWHSTSIHRLYLMITFLVSGLHASWLMTPSVHRCRGLHIWEADNCRPIGTSGMENDHVGRRYVAEAVPRQVYASWWCPQLLCENTPPFAFLLRFYSWFIGFEMSMTLVLVWSCYRGLVSFHLHIYMIRWRILWRWTAMSLAIWSRSLQQRIGISWYAFPL